MRRVFSVAFALLAILASCNRPCRPLAAPRPMPVVVDEDPLADVCEGLGDDETCREAVRQRLVRARWNAPRCAADDPDCGPELVRGNEKCFRTSAPRKALYHRNRAAIAAHHCRYDGECSYRCELCMRFAVGAFPCAEHIYRQDSPVPPNPFADPWGGVFPDPTWCGCVEGYCGFFAQ